VALLAMNTDMAGTGFGHYLDRVKTAQSVAHLKTGLIQTGRGKVNRHLIATAEGAMVVHGSVDNRASYLTTAKELPQVDTGGLQGRFVGTVAEHQPLGKIHHPSGVSLVKPDGVGQAKDHRTSRLHPNSMDTRLASVRLSRAEGKVVGQLGIDCVPSGGGHTPTQGDHGVVDNFQQIGNTIL